MMTKYEEMHESLVRLCNANEIALICGKVPYREATEQKRYRAQKVFFVLPEHFDSIKRLVKEEYKKENYSISVSSKKELERKITITRTDILATTVNKLMLNPEALLGPTITIRTFKEDADLSTYSIIMQKEVCEIPVDKFKDFTTATYAGGIVHIPMDVDFIYSILYGNDWKESGKVAEYPIFEENLDKDEMLAEAKQRGYFTTERENRDAAFRRWRKEVKAPALKDYKEYRNRLLALGLPIEEEEDADSE